MSQHCLLVEVTHVASFDSTAAYGGVRSAQLIHRHIENQWSLHEDSGTHRRVFESNFVFSSFFFRKGPFLLNRPSQRLRPASRSSNGEAASGLQNRLTFENPYHSANLDPLVPSQTSCEPAQALPSNRKAAAEAHVRGTNHRNLRPGNSALCRRLTDRPLTDLGFVLPF